MRRWMRAASTSIPKEARAIHRGGQGLRARYAHAAGDHELAGQ